MELMDKILIQLDEGAFLPVRAHETDAGMDLFAREGKGVPAGGSAVFDTGVHIQIPEGMCVLLVSKSGLNVKHDITSTGLIDAGYEGSIRVKLYNHGTEDYTVLPGEKISQAVILPCICAKPVRVDRIERTSERGEGGFGSSGRFANGNEGWLVYNRTLHRTFSFCEISSANEKFEWLVSQRRDVEMCKIYPGGKTERIKIHAEKGRP